MMMPRSAVALMKRLAYGERLRPARDWFVLLSLAGILIVASAVWNLGAVREVERSGAPENLGAPAAFDETPIASVRAVFEARADAYERYRTGPGFVDPSR